MLGRLVLTFKTQNTTLNSRALRLTLSCSFVGNMLLMILVNDLACPTLSMHSVMVDLKGKDTTYTSLSVCTVSFHSHTERGNTLPV